MLERVIACIERYQLLPERGEVIVGVSGGADSLCLAHLLRQFCGPGKRYPGITLHAAHLNHMLRGAESERDASAVASIMDEWEIPCTLGKVDVPALAKREKRSLEDAARVARYRFLRKLAGGGRIAVAHHADDQVETLLLHWLRGSGLAGLVGMSPRQGDIIRPLLEITRAETQDYCRSHGIVPLEDHSNSDPRFLRNRVRHELLPLLQQLNPGIQSTLLRNAEVARVDLAWLEEQVDTCWPRVVLSERENAFVLTRSALEGLPLSLQRHLLRQVAARLCDGQSPLEPRHFSLIETLLKEHNGGQERALDLPQRLRVRCQHDSLIFERRNSADETPSALSSQQFASFEEVILPIPGEILVPGTTWRAGAEVLSQELTSRVVQALRLEDWPEVWRLLDQPDRYTAYIDGGSAGAQLRVRAWRPGDRMQPLGMNGEKKLQDIFIDKHIARGERATTPLFFADTHCLWAASITIDQRARLTGKTRRILRLSIRPA
jgi:tRNA(Ile)-lysidine synthase